MVRCETLFFLTDAKERCQFRVPVPEEIASFSISNGSELRLDDGSEVGEDSFAPLHPSSRAFRLCHQPDLTKVSFMLVVPEREACGYTMDLRSALLFFFVHCLVNPENSKMCSSLRFGRRHRTWREFVRATLKDGTSLCDLQYTGSEPIFAHEYRGKWCQQFVW